MPTETSSLPESFRVEEVKVLLGWVRAGESASIVGVSGVGKSNLFNHLLDPKARILHLGADARHFIFVRVNFNYLPDFTDRSIYSAILEQIELLLEQDNSLELDHEVEEKIQHHHEALIDSAHDALRTQRHFKLALRALLSNSQRRLVLLFDQFDDVYREAHARLFANLRGLREAYKYRLSYLAFTRDPLPDLMQSDPAREEFYELLTSNTLGLKPYQHTDAILLMRRIAARYQVELEDALAEKLFSLTAGHAGTLRSAFLAVTQGGIRLPDDSMQATRVLLTSQDVRAECAKIWNDLSSEEQRIIATYAHGRTPREKVEQIEYRLELKGLLQIIARPMVFSPIFAEFARNQKALWEQPLYLDERGRSVWVLGNPVQGLTKQEYRLVQTLFERADEIVSKDDIIRSVWPDAQGGVSDEALITTVSRLRRKIEPDPSNPRFLETVRDHGYRLKTDYEEGS